jgi:hypothetical protein
MWSRRFVKNLKQSVIGYQSVLQGPTVPIRGGTWEFVMSQAAEKSRLKYQWDPSSHRPGSDIVISKKHYSCKTSKVNRDHMMISSYRLSTKANSNTPHAFIDEIDNVRHNFDFYAILAREQRGEYISRYTVYQIPADRLKAGSLVWQKELNGNWYGNGPEYTMKIVKSTSYQLWMKVPLQYIEEDRVLDIDIGNTIRPINLIDIYSTLYVDK